MKRSPIPPDETFVEWPRDLREGEREQKEHGGDFRVALTFRDTAGRVWHRDEQGRLDQTGVVAFAGAALVSTANTSATGLVGEAAADDDPEPEQ